VSETMQDRPQLLFNSTLHYTKNF